MSRSLLQCFAEESVYQLKRQVLRCHISAYPLCLSKFSWRFLSSNLSLGYQPALLFAALRGIKAPVWSASFAYPLQVPALQGFSGHLQSSEHSGISRWVHSASERSRSRFPSLFVVRLFDLLHTLIRLLGIYTFACVFFYFLSTPLGSPSGARCLGLFPCTYSYTFDYYLYLLESAPFQGLQPLGMLF